jgi:hypothetical protein
MAPDRQSRMVMQESSDKPLSPRVERGRLRRLPVELALLLSMFMAYRLGRQITAHDTTDAFRNADEVWRIERWFHLPDETVVQQALLQSAHLAEAANAYYAFVHFPLTLACLVWLFLRHPAHYLWVRRSMVTLTAIALVVHVLYPLAPPRMLPGFVDTGQLFGPNVYGDSAANSVANQFAAMPSLHVGWALLVAIAMVSASSSRWRYLWFAHPVITVLVVVATANHYWLDGLVAGGILAATLGIGIRVPVAEPSRASGAAATAGSA